MKNNRDTGFVFIKLDNNNAYNRYFETIREFINNNPVDQTVIFNSYNERINTNNIPILHLSHAKFFYGNLFLFELGAAILSKNFTNINKRYLYVHNAPWLESPSSSYSIWKDVYGSENLEFITANQQIYDLYEICWKKPIGISENFTYEELSKIIF